MAAKSTGSKWLLGCGIGCGAVLVIASLLGFGGFMLFRNTFQSFEQADETRGQLVEAHGAVEDFVPPPDGTIPAARIEAFLAVRDSLAASRQAFEGALAYFPEAEARMKSEDSGWQKFRLGLQMARRGAGMGEIVGRHFGDRNRALLAQGMGVGEYTWLYALAYYSWLGHPPSDAPEKTEVHFGDEQRESDLTWEDETSGEPDLRHRTRRISRQLLAMLENQLAALDSLPSGEVDPRWRAELESEIARLRDDPGRMPWQDDLPPRMAAALAPYRERFEATYSRSTNPFELSEGQGRSGISFRTRSD